MAKRKIRDNWAALNGSFDFKSDQITFKGGTVKYGEEQGPAFGTAICDKGFGGHRSDIQFFDPCDRHKPNNSVSVSTTKGFPCAGARNEVYGIIYFENKWTPYAFSGDKNSLLPKRFYHIETRVRGSMIKFLR